MKAWLIAMIGVVVLIAVAEMILPEGRMRAAIRSTFAIVLMLVVLSPLPQIRDGQWGSLGTTEEGLPILDRLDALKVKAMEDDCRSHLASLGYDVSVKLVCLRGDPYPTVQTVTLYGDAESQDARFAAARYFGIEEEIVSYEVVRADQKTVASTQR